MAKRIRNASIGHRNFLKGAGLAGARNPSNDMPLYPANELADQQVADIFVYLQSLTGPKPASDLPSILND